MALINYTNKTALNENPDIPNVNKVTAGDMNEIKNAINNLIYPVGSYYETSDTSFNPNNTWGGTWVLEQDGTVLVSQKPVSGSAFNGNVGDIVGEEKHTLIVDEMPSHVHMGVNWIGKSISLNTGSETAGYKLDWQSSAPPSDTGIRTNPVGGGQAHNIVQPSKIVNRWHRIA